MAPVVEISTGRVGGRLDPSGEVAMFLGIPFAAPPTGARRLRPPEAPAPWPGVLDATRRGAAAPQQPGLIERLFGGAELRTDEDCLTLNVWTPAAEGARRPVMVWIHGGGFVTGSGALPLYDGRRFVRGGDVVFVTLNYRLGPLGFLHLGELGGEAWAGSGNAGLLDQLVALRWVRDNIAAFGGDPGDVTIFGESAGAMSVGALLGLPEARGLFRRAILQSGACNNVSSSDRATAIALETLEALGLGRSASDLARLHDVPVTALLDAEHRVGARHLNHQLPFQPVVDGVALPEPPLDAVGRGSAAGVSIVCGTTADEMRLFTAFDPRIAALDHSGLVREAADVFGDDASGAVETYSAARPGATPGEVWSAIATDVVFRIPAVRLLERQVAHDDACWAYEFTYRSNAFGGVLGACHALDVPFVFDLADRPGLEVIVGDGAEVGALSRAMHRAWISFARAGDPSHPGLPPWPRWEPEHRSTMELGPRCRVVDDPRREERLQFA